jgi:hypothetical protein
MIYSGQCHWVWCDLCFRCVLSKAAICFAIAIRQTNPRSHARLPLLVSRANARLLLRASIARSRPPPPWYASSPQVCLHLPLNSLCRRCGTTGSQLTMHSVNACVFTNRRRLKRLYKPQLCITPSHKSFPFHWSRRCRRRCTASALTASPCIHHRAPLSLADQRALDAVLTHRSEILSRTVLVNLNNVQGYCRRRRPVWLRRCALGAAVRWPGRAARQERVHGWQLDKGDGTFDAGARHFSSFPLSQRATSPRRPIRTCATPAARARPVRC